ncbi:fasciclin domain-containing protein [Mucilaginibacter sp. CSA2-8R]|uniref:fasciclin domain-containing protein n=1 Tax=Mucilaginibacter sp. CSA2-8R TaxID=3141542 RepID=UPI00315D1A84
MNRIMPAMVIALGVLAVTMSSCRRQNINYSTTSTVNIYSYLDQNADQFSLFKQIVDKAGYASFLNTYGAYTLFAANNAGVNAYLKANNKASVDAIDEATAKKIVSISLIADTISSQLFTDGKMRSPTTNGQFLITGAANNNGVTNIVINKQANLVKSNTRVGNGIIHVIDNVLSPAPLTLAQMVEQDTKYSIFTEALKATGFYDSLNVAASAQTNTSRKYLTLIAQTNAVFNAAGFANFDALKRRYSTTGNPKNPQDSLYLYVAYRVFPELSYLSDIVASSSHTTLAPLEVTTSELSGQDVLLNNITFNGVLEPGVVLDRTLSDNSASNGVLHSVKANYAIKVRKPTPVYFDVADQPEIRRTPGLYRVPGKTAPFTPDQLIDVDFPVTTNLSGNVITYTVPPLSDNSQYFGNDFLLCGGRFRVSAGVAFIEFRTPLLVKGRYKVWVDYKQSNGGTVGVTFDGQAIFSNTFNQNNTVTDTETDAQLEAKGFKRYTAQTATGGPNNGHVGRLLGVINIPTTDRHTIRFIATAPSSANHVLNLDLIEFRPIDMASQIFPKFAKDGSLVY